MRPIEKARMEWDRMGFTNPFDMVIAWHLSSPFGIVHCDEECFLLARAVNSQNPEKWVDEISKADSWRVTVGVGQGSLKKLLNEATYHLPKIAFCRPIHKGGLRFYDTEKLKRFIERR